MDSESLNKRETLRQQLVVMLDLQQAMNAKVTADWASRGFEWYRAIWVECAEMLDHYGWKWWKKQTPDIEQVQLELVDIWHFGLSLLLLRDGDRDDLLDQMIGELVTPVVAENEFPQELEAFALTTLASKDFDIQAFKRLMTSIGLSFDELYRRYVGKNVLNLFRQDNGYQTGKYVKQWSGREDNEHLVEVVAALDPSSPGFKDALYVALENRYRESLTG